MIRSILRRLGGVNRTSDRGFSRKIKSTFAYGLGPLLGLLSGPILARALGPQGRGQFAAIMEPLTLATALATFGIPAAVAYYVSHGYGSRETYRVAQTLAWLPIFIAVCVAGTYSGLVSTNQNIPVWVLWSLWALIVPSALVQLIRARLQGESDWSRLDRERFSFAVLRFAMIAIVAVLGFNSAGWFAAGALAAFLIASLALRKRSLPRNSGLGAPAVRSVLTYSLYSGIGTIAVVANNRLDQAILPLVSNTTEMGFYAAAVTISEVPIVFAALAGRNVLPLATRRLPFGEVIREIRFHLLLGVLALTVLFIFADWYVPLLFGRAFLGSVAPLRVLLVSVAFALISNTLVPFISGRGWPGLSSVVPLAGLVPTAILYSVLPHPVSAFVAAVVALLSSAISLIGAVVVCLVIENRKVYFAARRWSSHVTRGI